MKEMSDMSLMALCMIWLGVLAFMIIRSLKMEHWMLSERRLHEEQMRLFGKIAYHHGFVDGGMRTGYDYDREYPKIKEHFKEKVGELE